MYNLAAMVDGVLISAVEDGPGSAHMLQELKERKALLSEQLAQAMECIDALLEACFQQQRYNILSNCVRRPFSWVDFHFEAFVVLVAGPCLLQ